MSLRIARSGVLDTLQDTGRYGYGKWGINPTGAMDHYATQAANALAGNALAEGVIEMHFPAPEIHFQRDALISITGADFIPAIDGQRIPLWRPIEVRKDTVLSFLRKMYGSRCYLSVHGGFAVPQWLQSFSTNLKVSAGGWHGRSLKKDDVVPFRDGIYPITYRKEGAAFPLSWSINPQPVYADTHTISFLEGREWRWLEPSSQHRILTEQFGIDPSSDRMALLLRHVPLQFHKRDELLSSAVSFGTIQALPSGNLMVLMADHQTTGGYPRIGNIITAHLPKLAQRSPGDALTLRKISIEDAEKMVFSLRHDLHLQQQACRDKLDRYYAQR